MENESAKKALIYFVSAGLISFILIKILSKAKSNNTTQPTATKNAIGRVKLKMPQFDGEEDNSTLAMQAFVKAYNSNESEDRLIELNEEMKNSMGVYAIKTKDSVSIKDLEGKDVLVYKTS